MIARPPSPRGGIAGETKTLQIQLFNEEIIDANEAVLTDSIVQPFREKHRPATINALDESRHARLRLTCGSLP